jgi:hypothetical protein
VDAPIKVIKNSVPRAKLQGIVDYIDYIERSHPEACNLYQDGKRVSIQFGHDLNYGKDPEYKFFLNLELMADLDKRKQVVDACLAVLAKTKDIFEVREELYVSAFWLAKQYPGATIPLHDDTDDGQNLQYIYSAIVYLNEVSTGGELSFVDLGYSHKPELGDMVIFPTQTTGGHTVAEILEDRYSLVLWLTSDKEFAILPEDVK